MADTVKRSRRRLRPRFPGAASDRRAHSEWRPEDGVPRYIAQMDSANRGTRGPSLAGLVVGFASLLTAYFVAEAALASEPHPLHWLVAALAGIVGGVASMVAARMCGR